MRDKENEIKLAAPIDEFNSIVFEGENVRLVEANNNLRWQYRDNKKDDWRWVVLVTEQTKVLCSIARSLKDGHETS